MLGPVIHQIFRRVFDSTNNALRVNVVAGSSGSGNMEYTEGDTDATITGIAALTEGPSNTLTPIQSNAAKEVLVRDGDAITQLTAIAGFVDGLEGLLTTLSGYVDQLEGYTDGIEGLLTTINSSLGTLNTSLATIDGHVDGLEALATSLNGYVDQLEGFTDGLEGFIGPATTFFHGSKSGIGTSEVALASAQALTKGVTVKAAIANTGIVYVGKTGLTNGTTDATDGFELGNGESCFIQTDNFNDVFVIGSAAGQKVFFIGV